MTAFTLGLLRMDKLDDGLKPYFVYGFLGFIFINFCAEMKLLSKREYYDN